MPLHRKRYRNGEPSKVTRHKPYVSKKKDGRSIKLKGHNDFTELEVALMKCLIRLGVSQTIIADMIGTYPKYVSDIKLGRAWQHIVGFEVWSRDVTGELHQRVTEKELKQTWDDAYSIYNNKKR